MLLQGTWQVLKPKRLIFSANCTAAGEWEGRILEMFLWLRSDVALNMTAELSSWG